MDDSRRRDWLDAMQVVIELRDAGLPVPVLEAA
jgi:hypothetical protein